MNDCCEHAELLPLPDLLTQVFEIYTTELSKHASPLVQLIEK